jgi:hypothetical protein
MTTTDTEEWTGPTRYLPPPRAAGRADGVGRAVPRVAPDRFERHGLESLALRPATPRHEDPGRGSDAAVPSEHLGEVLGSLLGPSLLQGGSRASAEDRAERLIRLLESVSSHGLRVERSNGAAARQSGERHHAVGAGPGHRAPPEGGPSLVVAQVAAAHGGPPHASPTRSVPRPAPTGSWPCRQGPRWSSPRRGTRHG